MKPVILRPIITEKSTQLIQKGWYSFAVALDTNKIELGRAVEDLFKVHVINIRTSHVKGKTKRSGKRRVETHLSDWKKALVKLKPNEKIDLFQVETSVK